MPTLKTLSESLTNLRWTAKQHNIRVWEEHEARVVCTVASCDEACLMPRSYAEGADKCICPTCGGEAKVTDVGARSWWWETCAPGCLPDSEVMGPFDSESEALEDATEGLEES